MAAPQVKPYKPADSKEPAFLTVAFNAEGLAFESKFPRDEILKLREMGLREKTDTGKERHGEIKQL